MDRYLLEAIHIENGVEEDTNMMLNFRGEWGLVATKRLTTAALELPPQWMEKIVAKGLGN